MFYRLSTDGVRTEGALEGSWGGPTRTAAWLIGGGRSLTEEDARRIVETPAPRMGINLAGSGWFRPTLWTAYDPSARFHRSVYLDPGIVKFVHRRRGMDLVPETTYKVCDCPQTYFFDREGERGFGDFLVPGQRGIVDWADSMVQGIDILYRLGIRRIYLAGCEMRVRPSEKQMRTALGRGIEYREGELLLDFVKRCERGGVSAEELDEAGETEVYHFDERKPIRSAANTDFHYFRVAQYLRLSRRNLSLAGVELISTSRGSRLNDYFPYRPITEACREILMEVGDPAEERTAGRYRLTGPRVERELGAMRDFRPHRWEEKGTRKLPAKRSPAGKNVEAEGGTDLLIEQEGLVRGRGNERVGGERVDGEHLEREVGRMLREERGVEEEG